VVSDRFGRNAVTKRRSDDPEEDPQSGRCAAISRSRFRPVDIQEFPLRRQVVPDPLNTKTSAALMADAAPIEQ
jgi:hypothetical protein